MTTFTAHICQACYVQVSFYFTMILVLVYAVALGSLFVGPVRVIGMFPEMDTSILALLSISHAAYLANKAIPHSTT